MIKYQNPHLFHLLWLVLIIFIVMFISSKRYRGKISKLVSLNLQQKLYISYNPFFSKLRKIFILLVVTFLIIALVNPKIGTRFIEAKREGIDIVVAVDLSRSMMAEDITPNRLMKTKHEVKNFIKGLKGDRISLVGFTSQAFVQCPLTTDYDAALMFLDLMNVDYMPQNGTSLSEAIQVSIKAFNQEDEKYKMLVIVSDGEDHEENIEDAIEEAKKNGVVVSCIGIGSLNGVPIPENGSYLKDNQGEVVITKLNEFLLKKIAVETDGNYYLASPTQNELSEIFEDISKMEKKEFAAKMYGDYEDRFQLFLFLAIIFLSLEILTRNRRSKKKIAKIKTNW